MTILASLLPVLFVAFALLLAVPIVASIRAERLDPFEPIVFYAVFLAMIGVLLFDRAFLSREPWAFDVIPHSIEAGVAIVLIAYTIVLASTLVGYFLSPRVLEFDSLRGLVPTTSAHARFLRYAGISYVVLGMGALAMLVVTTFGGDPLLLYRSARPRSQVLDNASHWLVLSNALVLGYLLYVSGIVAAERDLPMRSLAVAPLVPAAYVVTGSRGQIVASALMIFVFCYYLLRFRLIGADTAVMRAVDDASDGVLVVVGLLAGVAGAIGIVAAEALRMGRSVRAALFGMEPTAVLTAGVHEDIPDHFLALRELVPAERGYYFGTFYGRVLTNFVPRALWEGKPVLTHGSWLRRELLPDGSGGIPAREIGAYYVNFGFVGFVLLGGLFGIVLRLSYEFLLRNRHSPLVIAMFSVFLTTVGRVGLNNNVLSSFLQYVVVLAPVFVGYYVTTARSDGYSVDSDVS